MYYRRHGDVDGGGSLDKPRELGAAPTAKCGRHRHDVLEGDLAYTIAVSGNTFRETGGDDGRLTEIFTGQDDEGATGTLERPDLTAAFGTTR